MANSDTLQIPEGDFEGFIFDHDGTLSLSMHVHYDAWLHAFKINGGNFEFPREMAQSYAGIGMHDTVEILNERFGCSMDPNQVVIDQEKYYFAHLHHIVPYEPVVSFARKIVATHPVSVASGSVRPTVLKTMEAIGIADLFDIVVTQEDVTRSKPAPDLFLLAAGKMGVAPEKCLVFEDSKLGIQAAETAGMGSVFVTPADPV